MGLKNSEVLENLLKQRVEMEQQLESLRSTYLKVLGAIDALSQIEESNVEVEEETEVQEESAEPECALVVSYCLNLEPVI